MTAKFILGLYGDHLGNVRLTYADSDGDGAINPTTEIISEKNYYPFGLAHKGYNNTIQNENSIAHKFGYNGVEQEQAFDLNLYEMDLRQYDPAIARWTGIDPVTHHSMSTYTAFDNNPVFWADPSGADGEHYNWGSNRYENDQGEEVSFENALASVESSSPNDVIHISKNSKTYTVTEAEGDDIIYGDGERRTAERGVTQANLIKEGFKQTEAPEGVGMGAVDGAALILTGEAVFAWVGRGIMALWAARGTTKLITNARWAQTTFSGTFSAGGRFAGRTIDDVAGALRSGSMKVGEVPIDVIVRNGQSLILNTRSSAALSRAGIPRSQWSVVNRTGQEFFENQLTNQLTRNSLNSAGTATIRQSGTQNVIGF